MIEAREMQQRVSNYIEPYIGSLGSHSALDVSRGACDEGFKTIVACKKGREKTYQHHKIRNRGMKDVGCINKIMILENWKDIVNEENLGDLSFYNTIFVPNRSFEVYLGHDLIENKFTNPMLGNRGLLRTKERTGPYKIEKNQDYLVKEAGLSTPMKFRPEEIDRPVMVKAATAIGERSFQRAGGKYLGRSVPFPVVTSPEEYENMCIQLKRKGKTETEQKIIEENFRKAPIEEYMNGPAVNLNYFYSVVHDDLDFMGPDQREQFKDGEEFLHRPVSLRESLMEKVYDMGERFVETTKRIYPPGIIGPFALQTVSSNEGEEMLVIDVSLRIPGSPDTSVTPYTYYKHGEPISFGRRIAQEIKEAISARRLGEIVS